ncbi:MAG: glycosyltransferase family 39 protein [Armatimonadota bacterium]
MEFWNILQSTLLLSAVLGVSGLAVVRLRGCVDAEDPVWTVFVVALLIRVPLAIILYRTLPRDWLDVDWMMYESAGRALAEGGTIEPLLNEGLGALAHGLLNAAVFSMVGFQPLTLRALNAILGALACAIVYVLLERLNGDGAHSKIGALAVAVWPTFIAWSTTNSKEMAMAVAAIGVFYCALSLSRRFRPSTAAVMIALGLFMCLLRIYLVLLVLPVVVTYIIVVWSVRKHTLKVSVAILAIWTIAATAFLSVAVQRTVGLYDLGTEGLETLNAFRRLVARGGAQMEVAPFEHVSDVVLFMPQAVANYFLRPFPWEWGSLNQTVGALTMIAYYPFLLMTVVSIPRLWRRERAFTAFFVIQVLVLAAAYGTMEGNMGSLMRHRAYVEVLILGIGVTQFVQWLQNRPKANDERLDSSITAS